ncbi:MAG: ABC transporter substrate-binding protein [Chloroflexi bacterium]|nr:ABC transporter substrate-binding protein [Chloroflexota bacterium]
MKRWLSLAAVVVLCLALVIGAACGGEEGEEGVTELKMGVGEPLTGIYGAVVGIPAKHAFSLAADKIGEFTVGGEQYRWKLIFEDNGPSVAGGTSSTTKFIFEHNVDFMHQSGGSPALAAQPMCQEKGILLDAAGVSPEHFGPDKPLFLQTSATWAIHIPPFFDWLSKEHPEVKRVGYAVPSDETGYALADAIDVSAAYYGIEVVAPEFIPSGTVEYYPLATRIMSKNPDLLIGTTMMAEPMWELGYEGLCATWYWVASGAEKRGWDTVQGYLIFMPHALAGLWPEVDAIVVEFEDRYGVELGPSAFWALNVMYVLTDVLRQAGTVDDMDKIIETMETGSFDSLVGPISYGGEAINGVGHLGIWSSPIYEVVGEHEYRADVYTREETEALVNEVFK